MAEEKHEKDIHRYSYSRLKTFKDCPMKHHYEYVEQIPEPESEYLLSGSLFHKCVETILKGEEPDEVYKEWYEAVDTGRIHLERDLLEYIINQYFSYYYKDYSTEETIGVEQEYNAPLEDVDYFVTKVDQIYRINGLLAVRDIKTTRSALKYTYDDVKANMQLLTYVPPVEKSLNDKVNFIEIDEVRLAKLDTSVPLVKNGKPSTSLEALSLVTADLYRSELEEQNLIDDPKYKNVLALLEERGHPLFRRTKAQLLNRDIIETNVDETANIYFAAALDIKYRIKDKSKCFMCPYKSICEHDEMNAGSSLRNEIINSMH